MRYKVTAEERFKLLIQALKETAKGGPASVKDGKLAVGNTNKHGNPLIR